MALSKDKVEFILAHPNIRSTEIAKVLGVSRDTVLRVRKGTEYKGRRGSKIHSAYKGCDEDCFNCVYDDCYKPARLMRAKDYDEVT